MIKDLNEWIEKLKIAEKIIIVEGKKDKETLENLNIKNIFALNNKPLYKFIEEISQITKEVIILTDLDKEGKKLYSILKKDLQKHGVKIDQIFREFLIQNTKLSCIESLEKII